MSRTFDPTDREEALMKRIAELEKENKELAERNNKLEKQKEGLAYFKQAKYITELENKLEKANHFIGEENPYIDKYEEDKLREGDNNE